MLDSLFNRIARKEKGLESKEKKVPYSIFAMDLRVLPQKNKQYNTKQFYSKQYS